MSQMEKMPIPRRGDGEPNFQAIALIIVEQLPRAEPGELVVIHARADSEIETFRAFHPEPGRLVVATDCLGQRFPASLFMALKSLAPDWVESGEVPA